MQAGDDDGAAENEPDKLKRFGPVEEEQVNPADGDHHQDEEGDPPLAVGIGR